MIKHIICALLATGLGLASLTFTCYLIYPITTLGPLTSDIKVLIWVILITSFLVPVTGVTYIWRILNEK